MHKKSGLLTPREHKVLELLYDGKSNPQIAKELSISPYTAKAHVCSILQKLSVSNRVSAVAKAINSKFL